MATAFLPAEAVASMPQAVLHEEIDALRSRIKAADEELRLFRETIRQRAVVGKSINDELIQAGRLETSLRQRQALLEGLERLRK
jgi:hypothetical protein